MADELVLDDLTKADVEEFYGDGAPGDVVAEFADAETEPEKDPEAETDPEAEIDPEAEPEKEPEPEPEADPEKGDAGDDQADILSKSGKYTIPYEKLTEARDAAKEAIASSDAAEVRIIELTAMLEEAKKTVAAGDGDKVDGESSPGSPEEGSPGDDMQDLADEFPSVAKDLLEMKAELNELRAGKQEDAVSGHFDLIEQAHENSQEILTSREFSDWVETKPGIVQDAYSDVFRNGTTPQVISMIDDFLTETKPAAVELEADGGGDDTKVDLDPEKVISDAKDKKAPPVSLSDVPGQGVDTDVVETLLATGNSGKAVDDMFAGKTHEQIEELVNKLL